MPRLTDVAGPRVLTRPVAGLSLLHVEAPVFTGPHLADRTAVVALLIVLSPLFVAVSVVIRRDYRGLCSSGRSASARSGTSFPKLKFRTMLVGAEAMLPSLQHLSQGPGPAFQTARRPAHHPHRGEAEALQLGKLPQLVNVLRGQMSPVGPRAPLPCDVETYGHDVRQRLLVKLGMTGLWQINGRSDLSWDESVRFDLYYVANWSVMSDMMLRWRTGPAVLHSAGAY